MHITSLLVKQRPLSPKAFLLFSSTLQYRTYYRLTYVLSALFVKDGLLPGIGPEQNISKNTGILISVARVRFKTPQVHLHEHCHGDMERSYLQVVDTCPSAFFFVMITSPLAPSISVLPLEMPMNHF